MAAAAIMMRKQHERKEQLKEDKKEKCRKNHRITNKAMSDFDTNKNGFLDVETGELRAFITQINFGVDVSDEAYTYVLDKLRVTQGLARGAPVTQVGGQEIVDVLAIFKDYLKEEAFIERHFRKYDKKVDNGEVKRDGLIDKDELKAMMTAMADGKWEVMDADVEHVMEEADANKDGSIGRAELKMAVASWKALMQEKQGSVSKSKSSFCRIA